MEWAVDIRASVRDHLDLANLKLRSFRVTGARSLAAEIIANDRRGEPFVGNHPVLDGVAQIDEAAGRFRHAGWGIVGQPLWLPQFESGRRCACPTNVIRLAR